jgi:hypothetical protein
MADPRVRAMDAQLTGMAGEFLTAGKLFKLGFQVSVTLGNAKAIDLFVRNPKTKRTFTVQVKALRGRNCFPMHRERLDRDCIYVFVILNSPQQNEDYYIVNGGMILDDIDYFFGTSYSRAKPSSVPAINLGPLKQYRDNWQIFDL